MGGKYIILIGDGMADWPIAAIAVTYPSENAPDAGPLADLVRRIADELGRRIRGAPRTAAKL